MTYHYNVDSPNLTPESTTWMPPFDDPYLNIHIPGGWITFPGFNSSNTLTIAEIKFSANTLTNPTPLNSIKFSYKLSNRKYDNAYIKEEKIINIDILDK